jgi:hypothetical protein
MAVKIYRTTDRIPVKIGELTFRIAPLSSHQKIEILSCHNTEGGTNYQNASKATFLVVKYGVKAVEGLEYATSDEPYELKFDDQTNSALTDECVNELLSMEYREDLVQACFAFMNKVPKEILNPTTGKPLKGVQILKAESTDKKK